MPTYEYKCPNGHHFELFQKMSDEPRARCPDCGEESERILSGGAGFLFKGDGFYITDYRSDSYKKEASKEAPPGEGKKDAPAPREKSDGSTTPAGSSKDGGSGPSSSGGSSAKEA